MILCYLNCVGADMKIPFEYHNHIINLADNTLYRIMQFIDIMNVIFGISLPSVAIFIIVNSLTAGLEAIFFRHNNTMFCIDVYNIESWIKRRIYIRDTSFQRNI